MLNKHIRSPFPSLSALFSLSLSHCLHLCWAVEYGLHNGRSDATLFTASGFYACMCKNIHELPKLNDIRRACGLWKNVKCGRHLQHWHSCMCLIRANISSDSITNACHSWQLCTAKLIKSIDKQCDSIGVVGKRFTALKIERKRETVSAVNSAFFCLKSSFFFSNTNQLDPQAVLVHFKRLFLSM